MTAAVWDFRLAIVIGTASEGRQSSLTGGPGFGVHYSDAVRYDMLGRFLSGKRFGEAVRGHWGIESMHWVLDVTFRGDDSRTRERTLANNLSWIRRFAVTLLKRHPIKDSIRGKMIRCLMNTQ